MRCFDKGPLHGANHPPRHHSGAAVPWSPISAGWRDDGSAVISRQGMSRKSQAGEATILRSGKKHEEMAVAGGRLHEKRIRLAFRMHLESLAAEEIGKLAPPGAL